MKHVFYLLFLGIFTSPIYSQTSTLYGNVVDEDGQPYVGLELKIEELEKSTFTDEFGNYKFIDVETGDYPLVLLHPYGNVYKAIYMDGADYEYNVEIRRRIEFDAITVAQTRSNPDLPINRQEISEEEIEDNDFSQDLPYMLKRTRSVVVNSDAGTGIGYTGVRIRGIDPSHVNVTLNGIPINDSESQLVFWVNMPDLLSSTESIQIERGLGGSTFGAGDFGASVSVNTNKIRTKSYVDLTTGFGSFNTLRGTAALGTGLMNNKFTLDGRISYIQSDGYIDRASARLNSFMLSGAWLGLNSSLRLNVINGHEVTYQAWNGVPVSYVDDENLRRFNSAGQEAFQPGSDLEHHQNPWPDEVDNYTQTHVQLFFNHINDLGDWSSTLHYTRGLGYFELYQASANLADYNALVTGDTTSVRDLVERRWLDNHFIGANVGWKRDLGKIQLRAAGAYNVFLGDHFGETIALPDTGVFDPPRIYYQNDATKTDLNLFTKLQYQLSDKWLTYVDLQYRNVGYEYSGVVREQRSIEGDASFNFFNPKVGLSYLPNPTTKAFLYYGRGNKEPNRDDFIDSALDEEPRSEKMNNIEMGLEKRGTNWYLGGYAYVMDYKDQLIPTGRINDVGESVRVNVDKSSRIGAEFEFGWKIKNLSFNGNVTWSQNKINEFVEYVDDWENPDAQLVRTFENVSMALAPEWIGFLGLRYDWESPFSKQRSDVLSLTLDHKYVGDQFLDNTENDQAKLDAYFYADAGLEYKTTVPSLRIKELVLRLRIMNVYNALYSSNGWNYRFRTPDETWVGDGDRPYLRQEQGELYTLTGLYPQAPVHFQTVLAVRF